MSSSSTLRQWLAAEPFDLAMSSGFFGFYAHCGVLRALEEQGLLPVAVSGSSAGALVTGAWAAGVDARELERVLRGLSRQDFWDPALGAGLLRGARFRAMLDELLPARTFADARVPASISTHDVWTRRTHVISEGEIAPAIHASCAVPIMFHPVRVGARTLVDGGVSDRPGLAGIARGRRVLFHHLASRSPWRRKGSASMQVPRREGLVPLVLRDLPRVGPYKLHEGLRALEQAHARTLEALDQALPTERSAHGERAR